MKKRWLPYVIFGLVFYLLFLIIEMPASWFAWGLNRYTTGAVRLDPIAGSLWRGQGRLVVYHPQSVPHDLGNAEWRINPFWLFAGRVQMHWRTDSAEQRIDSTVRFGSDQLQMLDTTIDLPVTSVSTFYPAASLISPQGRISLRSNKLIIGRDGLEGKAEIQWLNASSSLSPVQPLGTYRLEVNGTGKTASLKLSTLQGPLEIIGQGQWAAQSGQFQFDGTATPHERTQEMEPLLKLMGPEQAPGHYRLTLNGRLPLNVK